MFVKYICIKSALDELHYALDILSKAPISKTTVNSSNRYIHTSFWLFTSIMIQFIMFLGPITCISRSKYMYIYIE